MSDYINVIYGKNSFLNEEKLKIAIKKRDVEEINVNRYDLLETNNLQVLEDLMTISFFSSNKIVIIDNLFEILNEDESIIDRWVNYIKKPNPDVFLYIVLNELINEQYKIGKALIQYAVLTEVKDLSIKDFPKYTEKLIANQGYTIEKKALDELILRTNYNLNLIVQEIEKLTLYKYEDKKIVYHDVELLVSRNLEENIYELTNSLLNNNNNKTIQIYYDLITNNEDPIRIINNIANRLRQLLHTKLLVQKSFTQDDVARHFNIKDGVAYYLLGDANKVQIETLEILLERLSNLDYDIKTGKIDKKLGLEIFILGAQNVR